MFKKNKNNINVNFLFEEIETIFVHKKTCIQEEIFVFE